MASARATVKTKGVTRDKLAAWLPNHESVKVIENLASDVQQALPDAIDANAAVAEEALTLANLLKTIGYVVIAPSLDIPNERSLAIAGGLTLADGGAGLQVTLGLDLAHVNAWTKNQSVVIAPLIDAASIVVDASLSNNFSVTLGGNRTLANPLNVTDGMVLNFLIAQDGTGGRTLAYGTAYDFGSATPALSTVPGAVDIVSGIYSAATGKIECALRKWTTPNFAYLDVAQVFSKNQSTGMVALTDAATVALDASLSNNFELLATSGIGATRKIGNATNANAGMVVNIWFYQDASGSRALTWDTKYKVAGGGGVPAASTAANAVDFYSMSYSLTKDIWVVVQQKGVA